MIEFKSGFHHRTSLIKDENCDLFALIHFHSISDRPLAPRHEDVLGTGGITPPFLTSAVDESEWSSLAPPPVEGTHRIGDWMGPRASKSLATIGSRCLVVQAVTSR
jgi:hypothetical protein